MCYITLRILLNVNCVLPVFISTSFLEFLLFIYLYIYSHRQRCVYLIIINKHDLLVVFYKSPKPIFLYLCIQVPDRYGIRKDVVLGFDDLDSYVSRNTPYLGAAVGRCANRIGFASFDIDGHTYGLAKNAAKEHHLHGGLVGFDKVSS